ncbi:MAG: hypothetical protein HY791_07380 [Deltaproteobacteria bacterium]|nr:hypothetical protein [Deltaproteobacteria bacterium]
MVELRDEFHWGGYAYSGMVYAKTRKGDYPHPDWSDEDVTTARNIISGELPRVPTRPTRSRAWFPETFLFAPLVVTDPRGFAELEARVPDQTTTWQVLALAHGSNGAQAADVTTFEGTLPVVVEISHAGPLVVGDVMSLPIQVINRREAPLDTLLTVSVSGAAAGTNREPVSLGPGETATFFGDVRPTSPGEVVVTASVEPWDSMERRIEVEPRGRPTLVERHGTLGSAREISIETPSDGTHRRAQLTIVSGALGLIRSELDVGLARGQPDEHTLLLATIAPTLAKAVGAELEPGSLRTLRLLATQRALRASPTPSLELALTLGLAAALSDDPALLAFSPRWVQVVASAQRPDGTFGGESGWPLQRVLVTTAESIEMLSASKRSEREAGRARVRATGAFERHLRQIADPYTAARVLVSGATESAWSGQLIERVVSAIVSEDADASEGRKIVHTPAGVVRSDGKAPPDMESTALAALALLRHGGFEGPAGDLAMSVLGAYSPSKGWGDARSNLVCLRAVTSVFAKPPPERVEVLLSMDGRVLAAGQLSAGRRQDRLVMEAPVGLGGRHDFSISATPAFSGLSYTLSLESFSPWPRAADVRIELPRSFESGRKAAVALTTPLPPSAAVVEVPLPPGFWVDPSGLDGLVRTAQLSSHRIDTDRARLEVPAAVGPELSIELIVVPSVSGRFHTQPVRVYSVDEPGDSMFSSEPEWVVK